MRPHGAHEVSTSHQHAELANLLPSSLLIGATYSQHHRPNNHLMLLHVQF